MDSRRDTPWAGIALALIGAAAAMISGAHPILALAILLLWIGSLYLVPAPVPERRETDMSRSVTITRDRIGRLVENSNLAILLVDGERIVLANATAREALGAHVVGQDARVAFRHPAAIDLLTRERGGETMIVGLTGPRSNWLMRRQRVDDRYWLVELVDRSSEAELGRAHADFVANASHELRTPLASIIGYVETLEDEAPDADPAIIRKFHKTVLREARRLQSLVADLMSLSKVQAEKHEVPRDRVDLTSVVKRASHDVSAGEHSDRLVYEMDEQVLVPGEAEQLEQLVRNLVENALKYGDPAKPVTISLAKGARSMAELVVRDLGEGIEAEHLPHLTRRFYRTDPGRSRAAGGTGLGLAIVKHIVERHRGRLDIDSELGVGTSVRVRLPLHEDTA
ncbi:sensor histidine kinase [Paraurantiacibacter namhicola]|uniref:histidine kinase n=1 Tax=Paraurantiacibacter namhicola TaxID=645517 RepID=A0A1C7D8S7_9SPHN|nr:ATP-binding protein [Paraurantiacibacter namhicola]ANU07884.1 Alkaline phosphatase synthesis sensor protein PhoR [Paraurantiacibacter namhicola]